VDGEAAAGGKSVEARGENQEEGGKDAAGAARSVEQDTSRCFAAEEAVCAAASEATKAEQWWR